MDIGTNTIVVNSQPSKPTLIRVLGNMVNVVKTSIVTMVKFQLVVAAPVVEQIAVDIPILLFVVLCKKLQVKT